MAELAGPPMVAAAAAIGAAVRKSSSAGETSTPSVPPAPCDRTALYVAGTVLTLLGCVYFAPGVKWQWIGDIAWIIGTALFALADLLELMTFGSDLSTTWLAVGRDNPSELRIGRAQALLSLLSNLAFVASCVGYLPDYLAEDAASRTGIWGGLGMVSMWVGIALVAVVIVGKAVRWCRSPRSCSCVCASTCCGEAEGDGKPAGKPSDPLLSTASTDGYGAAASASAPSDSATNRMDAAPASLCGSLNSPLAVRIAKPSEEADGMQTTA
jgi:hypothetical protein